MPRVSSEQRHVVKQGCKIDKVMQALLFLIAKTTTLHSFTTSTANIVRKPKGEAPAEPRRQFDLLFKAIRHARLGKSLALYT